MDSFSTEILDMTIKDARNKKKTVDSKMDSIISLMREVECWEKAAEKAKEEADECSLEILAEMDQLIEAQRRAKETNDMHARKVYAQKAALANEIKELQVRVSDVLNEGDGSLAVLEEMRKSLEKRLTSAVIKKEAADKEKLEKEVTLAYRKSQMEKVVEESKRLEQEATETLKLQEFLVDRGHVVDILEEEISCKYQDVNLLKEDLEDYQDENENMVTEDYLRPIIQETIPRQECVCNKCKNILKGVEGRVLATREEKRVNRMCKSWLKDFKEQRDAEIDRWTIIEAVTDYELNNFDRDGWFYGL